MEVIQEATDMRIIEERVGSTYLLIITCSLYFTQSCCVFIFLKSEALCYGVNEKW